MIRLAAILALLILGEPLRGAVRNSVTAESLPGEMAKARQKLQMIAPPPADIPAATLEKLRAKSFGMNLQDDNIALWEVAARPSDFVKVGALGYRAAELVTRGRIRLQPPQPGAKGSKMPGPSPRLMAKAWGLNLNERATPEEQIKMADAAHATGKKFTAAPTGERLLSWGETKVGELARHVDLIVIQAERWMYEDSSPGKQDYVSKVLRFSRAIRAANPQCEIFIELGRRLDRGGGAAEELLRALALLCEKDPGSFDGFQPFITRQDTDDPKQGIGALYHLLAWLRPEALAASPNREPAGFAKPIAHDAEFFPTTKAYLRAGDLMRATVIRGNKNVPMTTNELKWVTRISWLNAVTTPGVRKALTFSAVDDVRRLLPYVPPDVDSIGYNLEGAMTPDSDYTKMPQSVAAFSKIVRASGRKFSFSPIRNTWTALEKRGQFDGVLKNCDAVGLQMQRFFESGWSAAALLAEVRPLVQKFKTANPNVRVNIQLWLGRQTVPQMIEGFRALEPELDVAVVGTHSDENGVLQVLQALRGEPP